MKRFLIFVMILCVMLWLGVGAQEDIAEPEPVETEREMVEPIVLPVTRLNVTIIDGMNDNKIELKNCFVRVVGELHVVEDSFKYSNTFLEGDRYSITIWIKIKK